MLGETIQRGSVPDIVLDAAPGAVLVLAGLDGTALRQMFDQVEAGLESPRVLFTRISSAETTEAAVEQLISQLADTARRLWPIWFTDIDFSQCRGDTLGLLAAQAMIRDVAKHMPDLQTVWADAAVDLALHRKSPRVRKVPAAVEVTQLSLAISRHGLVLIVDAGQACADSSPAAIVHVLEWVAQLTQCAVIALFSEMPPHRPPFDRILYGARVLVVDEATTDAPVGSSVPADDVWLAPWLGSPHPLSEIEQRLEKALRIDAELAPLFDCNQMIETLHGARPKVDFVWRAGRMVVELDGYGSHGNRAAFMYDRHRDYQLTVSGYTILRIANDEIAQDIGKAVEKIRDIVHLCRKRIN